MKSASPNQPQEPMLPASGSTACTDHGGRGCPCAFHARRRVYARDYASRQRRRALDAKRLSATTCPRRFGRHGVCRAALASDIIAGQLVVSCPACERMARGICRDCNAPVGGVVGKARRCAVHRTTANAASMRKYTTLNRDTVNARARASYDDATVRDRRNEYKRAWRKRNPEKIKAQKRRAALRQSPRSLAYHAEYRATHRRKLATAALAHYHGTAPLRTCITPRCSVVLTGRKKKCRRCKEREAQTAATLLATRHGRGRRTDKEAA